MRIELFACSLLKRGCGMICFFGCPLWVAGEDCDLLFVCVFIFRKESGAGGTDLFICSFLRGGCGLT